jgi:antitoxin FitA
VRWARNILPRPARSVPHRIHDRAPEGVRLGPAPVAGARAARAGKSLQEYLRGMLIDSTARPPVADVIARARARVDATGSRADSESILAARDADRR